jgi:hypothetical protein
MASSSLSLAGKSVVNSTLGGMDGTSRSAGVGAGAGTDAIERNPFILPSDGDIFKLREVELAQREQVSLGLVAAGPTSCADTRSGAVTPKISHTNERDSGCRRRQCNLALTRTLPHDPCPSHRPHPLLLQLRHTLAEKKIWEKTNYNSAMTQTRRMIEQIVPDVDPAALARARESKGLVSAATAAISRDRRREKETLQEFVQKKRDMFLVQMSLDIKREEISKMDSQAKAREAALRAAEVKLEEDAVRFDAFLKENDAQAHDALKKAEAQSKAKAEKMHELKKLKHALGVVAAEKGKLKEVLEEYKRYKAFLDALTPDEWVQARLGEQMALRVSRKRAAYEAKLAVWEELRMAKVAEVTAKAEADRKAALRRGMQPAKVDIDAVVAASLPPPPLLDDEPLPELSEEERELPMYFTEPTQLLEVFTQLEEGNLFLIQNCQDIEQQLEELRQLHNDTSAAMAAETAALEAQMAALQAQLNAEDAKAAALRRKVATEAEGAGAGAGAGTAAGGAKGDASADALDALLPELRARIVEVYERCGFRANASSDTISMLTALEGKLETLLGEIALLEPEYVAAKEKEKERERRVRVREARLKAAQEAHEIRQRRMLERAQAPVVKRTGKPIMYRSLLPKKVVLTKTVDPEEEREKEEAVFFS